MSMVFLDDATLTLSFMMRFMADYISSETVSDTSKTEGSDLVRKFYSKDERQIIEHMNEHLGTKHRSKPYDWNNDHDLKAYFMMLVASYMDYKKYWDIVDDLCEELDESMELYDPLTWFSTKVEGFTGDKIIQKAHKQLVSAEGHLYDLYDRAETELKTLIQLIMQKPAETQRFIWKESFEFDDNKLDALFEALMDAPHTYTVDESYDMLCSYMQKVDSEGKRLSHVLSDQPILLRLELLNSWCSEEDREVLMKYAQATERGAIVRDILIPPDMPLHNLHYAIQRLFGWQNSHLRAFELDEKDTARLTGNRVREWSELAGILFRGAPVDDHDKFWDDDYSSGNFKAWLKKKYTGPYEYGGYTEEFDVVKEDIELLIERFPMVEVREAFNDYYERIKDTPNDKRAPAKILRTAPILDLTMNELTDAISFDTNLIELMEKLEIRQVLGAPGSPLAEFDDLVTDETVLLPGILPRPVTNKLFYNYDFGDNWMVEITRVDDFNQLVQQGVVDQDWMEEAMRIVAEKHQPVCVHKIGGYVMDDVGGMRGFTDFLRGVYIDDDKEEKEALKEWAKGMGWSGRKVALKNML